MSHNLTTCMLSSSNDTGAEDVRYRRSLHLHAQGSGFSRRFHTSIFLYLSSESVGPRNDSLVASLHAAERRMDESMYGYRTTDDTCGRHVVGCASISLHDQGAQKQFTI